MNYTAHQAPLSMRFSRQQYWSGRLFPSVVYFPDARIKLAFPALADRFFTAEPSGKRCKKYTMYKLFEIFRKSIRNVYTSKKNITKIGSKGEKKPNNL